MIPPTNAAVWRCHRVLCTALGSIATFAIVAYAFVPSPSNGLPLPTPPIVQAAAEVVAPEPPLPMIIPLAKPAQLSVTLVRAVTPQPVPVGPAEMECLTEAVYYEARGEPWDGQRAVAEVITRRSRDKRYPKTICGVVYQDAHRAGCQFSFACDGPRRDARDPDAWKEAAAAATYELTGPGAGEDITSGATHFHALTVNPSWSRRFARTVQIGNHVFYRQPGQSLEARDIRGATS